MSDKINAYPVYIYNTLTRQKELFKPLQEGFVGMYVCGPTVYGDPHLGHVRGGMIFDVIFRYFRHLGYKVRYVRNITDVGHLEDENAGVGEDRIAKKARLEQVEPMEVAQYYTRSYHQALDKMNFLRPSIEPLASGHIIEQIELVRTIIDAGYAYEVKGSVYFDVEKFAKDYPYGQLSGKVLEDLRADTRGTVGQEDKKNSMDFALWKFAEPEHIMRWPSPWSDGFPGWHAECTAMSTKYLGNPFDIHGGGMELKFPHHEAEVAQNMAATGRGPANYWIHNNMLNINGQKMSKSLGNFITMEQAYSGDHALLEQAYSPMTIRFFILQNHYRSPVDFGNEPLKAAEKGYQRLMNALEVAGKITHPGGVEGPGPKDAELEGWINRVYGELSDDFNTAKAIASIFEMASVINALHHGEQSIKSVSPAALESFARTFREIVTDVLGFVPELTRDNRHVEGLVQLLIELRNEARSNKNYALSDKIRDDLAAVGIQLKDERGGGTSFSIVN